MKQHNGVRIGWILLLGPVLMASAAGAADDRPIEYRASGTWHSAAAGAQPSTWKAILFKSATGDALGGTMSIDGAAAISDATVQGAMTASSVTFGVVQGGATWATFSGSTSGSQLSGTYTFSAFNDTGAWSGTLTPVVADAAGSNSVPAPQ